MKKIYGKYSVADCEHQGDIDSEKNYLRSIGCEVKSSYWDGSDCGEAYITFCVDESKFVEVYNKIYHSAHFDADINDYIKSTEKLKWREYSINALRSIENQMAFNTRDGFWNKMPLRLFFHSRTNGMTPQEIADKCLSFLKYDYKVIGWATHIVDGCRYYDVLISASYKNLTSEIMTNGVGDYSLSHDGFLGKSNTLYGQCACEHRYINYSTMFGYEYLQRVITLIREGQDIHFRNQDRYYFPIDIIVTKSEYMDDEGTFKAIIERDGKKFKIKDPRSWTKKT